jgi:hypothetical protein
LVRVIAGDTGEAARKKLSSDRVGCALRTSFSGYPDSHRTGIMTNGSLK